MIRVAIIGASGYTGLESIEILLKHPEAQVSYLTALPDECGPVSKMFGKLQGRCDLDIEPLDFAKLADTSDVVLCCLPHKVSMGFVPKILDAGLKVIDFSADYRLKNADVYEKYYQEHTDKGNLERAVYGLVELYRERIAGADLIANPGCFPTGFMLGIAPLLKEGLIDVDCVINNAVTGASGAGKNPSSVFHFPNMNENLFAYGIGNHRHGPEMEQIAGETANGEVGVIFQPHVGAFDRGILSSVYADAKTNISAAELGELYNEFYKNEHFVRVLNSSPALKNVAGTNYCHVYPTRVRDKIVVFSAIDNLVKGASGQAIQNMNVMYGLDEKLGLI